MQRVYHTAIVVATLAAFASGQNKSRQAPLASGRDSLSYVVGWDIGQQLRELGATVEQTPFLAGFQDGLGGGESDIDTMVADSIRQAFARQVQERYEEQQRVEAEEERQRGESFLAKNKQRPGVEATESGLQYEVIEKGSGAQPTPGDTVLVSYRGLLLDSTVFDSTREGEPLAFDLQRIIPGLREGILMMREGASYRFFVPPELAYGEEGAMPVIPPNATLIFELRLVEVRPSEKVSGAGMQSKR